MLELLKKGMFAGIGAAVLTRDKIREATGVRKPILNYGAEPESFVPTLVSYSHLRRDDKFAA